MILLNGAKRLKEKRKEIKSKKSLELRRKKERVRKEYIIKNPKSRLALDLRKLDKADYERYITGYDVKHRKSKSKRDVKTQRYIEDERFLSISEISLNEDKRKKTFDDNSVRSKNNVGMSRSEIDFLTKSRNMLQQEIFND